MRVVAGILRPQRAARNHIMARHSKVHRSVAYLSTRSRIGVSEMLRAILTLRTFMTMAVGWDTIRDEMIRITTSIIRMSMGVSPADLDHRMSGICTAVDRTASSWADSILAGSLRSRVCKWLGLEWRRHIDL
jgi:hypothetical protein